MIKELDNTEGFYFLFSALFRAFKSSEVSAAKLLNCSFFGVESVAS